MYWIIRNIKLTNNYLTIDHFYTKELVFERNDFEIGILRKLETNITPLCKGTFLYIILKFRYAVGFFKILFKFKYWIYIYKITRIKGIKILIRRIFEQINNLEIKTFSVKAITCFIYSFPQKECLL